MTFAMHCPHGVRWVLLLTVGWSCSATPRHEARSERETTAAQPTAALVHPPTTSVTLAAESNPRAPFSIITTVRNGGRMLEFWDDSQFFSFVVIGPSGTILEPEVNRHVTRMIPPIELKEGELITREFHLLCGPDGLPGPTGACDWAYKPSEHGIYWVVVHYDAPQWWSERDGESEINLQSDTVELTYTPTHADLPVRP
jgi:hypothetical protein